MTDTTPAALDGLIKERVSEQMAQKEHEILAIRQAHEQRVAELEAELADLLERLAKEPETHEMKDWPRWKPYILAKLVEAADRLRTPAPVPGDMVERALNAHGEPLTAEEIALYGAPAASMRRALAAAMPFEQLLRNLLATIHRDGGQYTEQHGLEKSTQDAIQRVATSNAAMPGEEELAQIIFDHLYLPLPDTTVSETKGSRPLRAARAILSRLNPSAIGAEGWRLVPEKLTAKMKKAAEEAMYPQNRPTQARVSNGEKHQIRWTAMLAAAPTPPTAQEGK